MPNKTSLWSSSLSLAPSIKRTYPSRWLVASLTLGSITSVAALALLWRPLIGTSGPPGSLAYHFTYCAIVAVHWLIPTFFADQALAYAEQLNRLSDVQAWAIYWRLAIAAIVGTTPFYLLRKSYLAPSDRLTHVRGAKRYEGSFARKKLIQKLAKILSASDHDIAPGVPYPAELWRRHVFLIGGTGSGKSTILKPLIERIIRANEKLILFDPKGEFTAAFAEPSLLAPWDSRSFAWDIGRDLRNVGDMRRFAAALIKEGQDPMWSNAARQVIVGFMVYLSATRGTLWGWRELANTLSMSQQDARVIMWRYHREAFRSVERASVTTQGVLINLASYCAPIYDLAAAWGDHPPERRISLVEWAISEGPKHRQIILQGHGAYPDLTQPCAEGVFGLIAAFAASPELSDSNERKRWVIVDELPEARKIPLSSIVSNGRAKGFRLVAVCQDLSQLEEIHGKGTVRSWISMIGSLLIGKLGPGETSETVAKALGSADIERENVSVASGGSSVGSRTVSYAREDVSLYKPSELNSRLGPTDDRKQAVFALALGGDVYEIAWPPHRSNPKRAPHLPAAWTLGHKASLPLSSVGTAYPRSMSSHQTPEGSLEEAHDALALDPALEDLYRSLVADEAFADGTMLSGRSEDVDLMEGADPEDNYRYLLGLDELGPDDNAFIGDGGKGVSNGAI